MMDYGKISIIMGIYNCENTLSDAIESIINQTYSNWELIMCDDASTDNTYNVAKSYQQKYPNKIILISNDCNSKLAYSLNHCLKYVNGDYIARMDGDDISNPERLEKEIQYLVDHPEYDLVGCSMQRFNESGLADVVNSVDNPDYYTLKNRAPFHHATIVAKRKVYDTLGGYKVSSETARCEDYELWFRFYYNGFKGNNLKEPLYLVREDSNAIRRRTAKSRFNAFLVTKSGFKLLGYPKWSLIKPFLVMIFKSLVPFSFVEIYRKHQSKK